MRIVVNSLLSSIPNIANVFLVSILFYYVFGILAMQLMSGKLSTCTLTQYLDKKSCICNNGEWVPNVYNYNNIFQSMLIFFEVSTLE